MMRPPFLRRARPEAMLSIALVTMCACAPHAEHGTIGSQVPREPAPSSIDAQAATATNAGAMLHRGGRAAVWYRGLRRDQVIFKFIDALRVRLDHGKLAATGSDPALPGAARTDLGPVRAWLDSFPDAHLEPLNALEPAVLDRQREEAERVSGRSLPDQNNYYLLRFPAPTARAFDLAQGLLRFAVVDTAYLVAEAASPATPSPSGER